MDKLVLLTEALVPAVEMLEIVTFKEPWSQEALRRLCGDWDGFGVVLPPEPGEPTARAYGGMTVALGEGDLTNVAVRPDLRRRGLGRAIVKALLDEADNRGIHDVYLEVRVSNEAAINLYRSFGFSIVGTRKNFYRFPIEDAYTMHRNAFE